MHIEIHIYPDHLKNDSSDPKLFKAALTTMLMKIRRAVTNMVLGPSSGALGTVALLDDNGKIVATMEVTNGDPRTKEPRPADSFS